MKRFLVFIIKYLVCSMIILATSFQLPTTVHALTGASLSFDPAQIDAKQNDEIAVKINLFTNNESIASTDVWIEYDPVLVEPVVNGNNYKIQHGNLFQTVGMKVVGNKIYVYGIQENPDRVKQANGTVATIFLKAKTSGTTTLQFNCGIGNETSQVIRKAGGLENSIDCVSTKNHTADIRINANGNVLGIQDSYNKQLSTIYFFIFIGVLIGSISIMIYKRSHAEQI